MRLFILAVPLLAAGCLSDPQFVDTTTDVSSTPGVVLDGNGYTIDGQCNTDCVGLVISADNVVVRNVTIRGFDGGVSINNGASGVRFENVTVTDNIQHGIFVDAATSNFSCTDCVISDNGAMGVYFEYDSHGHRIENSEISFNGFRDKDTGDWFETQKNKRKDKREGLAIDSSQGNVIRNTDFFGNALAAVIDGGSFSDSILIASRQDKDLSKWDCLEPYVHQGKFVMDDAEFNTIENVVLQGTTSILVSDDNNTIRNVTGGVLIAESAVRSALLQPLTGLWFDFVGSSYRGDPQFVNP